MGIIKAAAGSVGGTLADQWLEIYVCESMPNDVLAMRGVRKKASAPPTPRATASASPTAP